MDMAEFCVNLRDADLSSIEVDCERLEFELERSEEDHSEIECEREG